MSINKDNIFTKLKKRRDEEETKQSEGFYLLGVDFNLILDILKKKSVEKILQTDYPGKFKNENDKQKNKLELEKIQKDLIETDNIVKLKSSIDVFGEYIDEDADLLAADIMGLQEEISTATLNPEVILNQNSSINQVFEHSKLYKKKHNNMTPKALYTMVKILYKRKLDNLQWMRIASLCEIIYKFLNKGEPRTIFFSKKYNLHQTILEELDEFWKTDFIFRGSKETTEYRRILEKYYT